jgi:hypothetical protein
MINVLPRVSIQDRVKVGITAYRTVLGPGRTVLLSYFSHFIFENLIVKAIKYMTFKFETLLLILCFYSTNFPLYGQLSENGVIRAMELIITL